jgi:hypothetical protein
LLDQPLPVVCRHLCADIDKVRVLLRIPVKWAGDSGDVGQSRSEATLVVFLH